MHIICILYCIKDAVIMQSLYADYAYYMHIICVTQISFSANQRLNNGLMFRLRWRRLFHKYSCCDTPSIDWSIFVWCAQPFPCQSFIVCFMANHVENTAALTCIWCIRLARTVNANKHSARFTGGRPRSTYSIPLPPFKVQERFTSPLHHSLGTHRGMDIVNGSEIFMLEHEMTCVDTGSDTKGMHESRIVSIVTATNPRKIENKFLQTR